MVNDPYRYDPTPQRGGELPGQGFSIDPGDRPYQQAGPIEPRQSGGGWFGRAILYTIVVILCAGGVYYGAHKARSYLPAGEVPLIHADTSPVKVKPDNPAGVSSDEAQPTYDRKPSSHSDIEQLLPPPETPLPKPQPVAGEAPSPPPPPMQTEKIVAPPPPPARIVTMAPVPKSVPIAGDDSVPATRPLPGTMPASPPQKLAPPVNLLKPPARVQTAALLPPPPNAKPGPGGPVRIQIAATTSPAAAQAEWRRMQHTHPDLLGNLQPSFQRADLGARGIFYRVQAGPVASRDEADKLCQSLKRVSIGCIIVRP